MPASSTAPYTSVFDSLFYDDDLTSGGPTDEGTLEVIKKSRINSVRAATEIFSRLLNSDIRSATNRAAVQAMFDGAPPYSEEVLRQQGQAYLSNFSSGVAIQARDAATSAYVDMLFSVQTLMRVKTNWGNEDERSDWEGIISEEWTRLMREWPIFKLNFLSLVNQFLSNGISLSFFPDDKDWRYRVSGLGDFYFPRMSVLAEDELEVACCTRDYLPHQLNELVSGTYVNPAWNQKEVEKAINDALLNKSYSAMGPDTVSLNPELVQSELKNNDLALSYATNTYIRTVHFWVKEVNGSVTHIISLRSGSNSEFLYCKTNKFKSMADAFTFFAMNIGDSGFLHSVRGLGWRLFNSTQAIDRTLNRLNDAAMMSSSIILQPGSEGDMQEAALTQVGTATFINPNVTVSEFQMQNVGEAVLPILSEMKSLLQNSIGQFSSPINSGDPSEGTKFAWKAKLSESAKISSTGMLLFYDPLEKLFRNCLKKQIRKDYRADEPGGQEVWDFYRRCIKRGVPVEALREIDPNRSTVVRALGAGSEAQRVLIFDELQSVKASLDPVGQYNLDRSWLAMRVGWDEVDQFKPKITQKREPEQTKTAMLENNQFKAGDEIEVLAGEMHAIHAPVHMEQINHLREALEIDDSQLATLFPIFAATVQHNTVHVEYLSQDKFHQEEAADLRKQLQQSNEILHNSYLKLQSEQEKQHQSQQEAGVDQPEPVDPKYLAQIQKGRATLDFLQEKHVIEMRNSREKHQQNLAFEDQKNANRVLQGA